MVHQRSEKETPRGVLRVLEGGRSEKMRDPGDVAFIDAFRRGDRAACEQLYDRLVGTVEGTLRRILGRRDRGFDDLVQSSFEQIVKGLAGGRFAGACSLRTWAASVTSHTAFNELRRRTRERRLVSPWLEAASDAVLQSPGPDAEAHEISRQILTRVRFHLAQMSTERATTVLLHDAMGHDLAEIAALSGISMSAAQSRLFRGRKELQRRLEREGWSITHAGGSS